MIAAEPLAEAFVELADTLVDEFDLIDFLQHVTARTSQLFDVDAAGLLLVDHHGRLRLMAASDERAEMLELFQIQVHEGPCQDCFHQGVAVVEQDLARAADRWPTFVPHAVRSGYRSVHAFPMRLRHQVIGALNLFSGRTGSMDADDARMVQALTDVATIGLLQQRTIRRGEVLAEELQGALNSRIIIEQAKGALAQIHHCLPEEAFERLRTYARARGELLTEVAKRVTSSPDLVPELTKPPTAH